MKLSEYSLGFTKHPGMKDSEQYWRILFPRTYKNRRRLPFNVQFLMAAKRSLSYPLTQLLRKAEV